MKILPVILSGGSGTRLWPISREKFPKQFYSLSTEKPLLIETLKRVEDRNVFLKPIILANEEHRFIVAEQCRSEKIDYDKIITEPAAKNTAPAVATASIYAKELYNEDVFILILPSDHIIDNIDSFVSTIENSAIDEMQDQIICFGVKPRNPDTGFGYIKKGEPINNHKNHYKVESFSEKPTIDIAKKYLSDSNYFWNSGIFMFSVKAISNEFEKYNNDILEYCRKSYENSFRSDDFIKLDSTYYDKITPISIDYAIMEKTNKSIINVVDFSWNDIGSFSRLWEIHEKDADNNVKRGDQIYTDSTRNSYLRSEGPLIATIDIDNLIVVAEKDVTLIAKKGSDNKISQMLSSLKAKNLEQAISHEIVYKPWGYYKILAEGQFFKVKELTIHPNQKLSLQKHIHRAEHWICVDGIAEIEKGEEVFNLKENQSIYIPPNEKHRIINNSSSDLIIIEVQTGQNLDEKDIERIEDDYQRI